MAMVYIFGIISGVFLVAMIMAAWVHNAAQRINEQRQQQGAYAGNASVARHSAHRHSGHHKPATAAT